MRIVLIGTPFHDYTNVLHKALIDIGIDTVKFHFTKSFLQLNKIKLTRIIRNNIIHQYNLWLIGRINREIYKYSGKTILLLFGINYFSSEQLLALKNKGVKIVSWFIDSIYAHPQFYTAAELSEIIITYNKEDKAFLKKKQLNAFFMPLMYDSTAYKKLDETAKDIDLYFIGSIKERLADLETILREFPKSKYKIIIDGTYSKKKIDAKKYPNLIQYYRGAKLTSKRINKLYNNTKVCLNIQPKQATSALNIRTFEVWGAGCTQITNGNLEIIQELFPEDTTIIYRKNIKDFPLGIKDALKRFDSNALSNKFSKKTSTKKHDFNTRVSELLSIIKEVQI
jgi:spore maturation protein CgeB